MKKITLAVLTFMVVFSGSIFAQGKYGKDSAECIKYLSYYKEYFKQKAYDEALPNWRQAYKLCPPQANQTMLIDGTTLMRQLIAKNASNPTYRAALIDTLMAIHDARANAWPRNAVTALNNKGQDLSNYVKNDPQKLYDSFEQILAANKSQTKASLFLFDLQSAIDLYGKGVLDAEQVINCYQRNLALLDEAKPANPGEAEQIQKVRTDLESLFIGSKVASCEDLIRLFTPRFEASPNDLNLVQNIVKMMTISEDCQNNELYLKAATSMYNLDPSHNSAYFLYRLNAVRNNVDAALNFIDEAIEYDASDDKTDATYAYEAATFCIKNGRLAKANAYARKALELDSSIAGKCYMIIGQVWGSTSCGGNEINVASRYWVAVDNLQKAKNADPSLTEEANRLIGAYSRYYPQTAEAFMYDLTDGQSYTVNCNGMTAVTTVRTQK